MSMASCAGGGAVAEEMIKFCSKENLESILQKKLSNEELDLVALIVSQLNSINSACKSGWY